MTAKECLKQPVFADFDKPTGIDVMRVDLPLYAYGEFNYERQEQTGLQLEDMKKLLIEEANAFKFKYNTGKVSTPRRVLSPRLKYSSLKSAQTRHSTISKINCTGRKLDIFNFISNVMKKETFTHVSS